MKDYKQVLKLTEKVRNDVQAYRSKLQKFLDGKVAEMAFRAYRVPMGIYEQRKSGTYMVRVRIGAGMVLPDQLGKIARLAAAYGGGLAHVTTRQDIQIHDVDIERTADIMDALLEVGLSSRGGGGNTVRNVTACPRSGVCPMEKFNVAPYALATTEYLLSSESSFNLPRKYKIAFSGCSEDCALASVADLGFFAHGRNGQKGFAVYAGGGLGPNPQVAIKVEDFVGAGEVFEVAEAIKRLFDRHGDRSNRHKARLRYVLKRLGANEFSRLYEEYRDQVRREGPALPVPLIRDASVELPEAKKPVQSSPPNPNVLPEKTTGYFTVRLRLANGIISARDMEKVADIAAEHGHGPVRTTQLQDLLITSVPGCDIENVLRKLSLLETNVLDASVPKIVACAGASTCKLGLCLARNLADAAAEEIRRAGMTFDAEAPVIRISGCPNSCGSHHIGQIGLEGRARRIGGRLMPFYNVLLGAGVREGSTSLAGKIAAVPARRLPSLLAAVFSSGKLNTSRATHLAAEAAELSDDLPEDYWMDFGQEQPFTLAGRGPGECGTGVIDVIRLDIDQAIEAIDAAGRLVDPQKSTSIYAALSTAARSLLVIYGLEPAGDRETFAAFREKLIEPGWVQKEAANLVDAAIEWRMGDRKSLAELFDGVRRMVERIRELFGSLDASLQFRISPACGDKTTDGTPPDGIPRRVDLRAVECPLNFVKAKLQLEKISVGDTIEFLLDTGEPARNVPASFAGQGQDVVGITDNGDHVLLKIRRKK